MKSSFLRQAQVHSLQDPGVCVFITAGLSELGLAQCEDKLSRRQNQKGRDLPCRLFIGNGCFNLTAGGRFWKERKEGCPQQGTSGRFTTRTEDLCTVQQKAIVQCPLVGSWGRQNLGLNGACWVAPALERRQSRKLCSPSLLFLIEIPLRRRPSGRRKGGARS